MTFQKKGTAIAEATAKQPKVALTDKIYLLKSRETPLLFFLNNRHSEYNPLQYFDEATNTLRALRYCTNQRSIFIDEQTGDVILGQIPFENGKLIVPKENPTLQWFLDTTPAKNVKFYEFNAEKVAETELSNLDIEFEAQKQARELDLSKLESVALAIPSIGNKALTMKSSELKRDVLLFAKSEPKTFLKLANNEDVELLGTVVWALENNILTFKNYKFFNGEDMLLEVPFDETNPNMMAVRYLKTKQGDALLKFIESQRK